MRLRAISFIIIIAVCAFGRIIDAGVRYGGGGDGSVAEADFGHEELTLGAAPSQQTEAIAIF
jgi:hypothetical protein